MASKTINEVRARIRQKFGHDLEIIDAKEPLRLQPIPEDSVGADPKCPDNCLLVHTAARMFRAKGAIFWKSSAYVDLVDEDGKRQVERFIVPTKSERVIANFDRGVPLKIGVGIILLPPPHHQKLTVRRKEAQRLYASKIGHLQRKVHNARVVTKRAGISLETAEDRLNRLKQSEKPLAPKLLDAIKTRDAAKQHLAKVRDELNAAEKQINVARRGPSKRKYIFDLTTRNGAIGNYRFVTLSDEKKADEAN